MKSILTSTLAMVTFALASLPAFAGDPNGIWKFKAKGPNGRAAESTLTLNWGNHQLSGTLDNRAGKLNISDAKFSNDEVTFTVVREFGRRLRKKEFTVHYTGKLDGDTIKGLFETTGRDKQPVSVPWEAQRAK